MSSIFDNTYVHPLPESTAHVRFGQARASWQPKMVSIAERLIRAYRATVAHPPTRLKDITDHDLWTNITRDNFGQMLQHLEAGDAEELSRFLCDFGNTYTWFGGITTGLDGYNHWDRDPQHVALSYFDKLICLAEALAVLPAENPEQGEDGNWGRNMQMPPDEVVDAIGTQLGIDVVPPLGVIPVAGVLLERGILHYRHINSLYLATRIVSLTKSDDSICEFGGGLGFVSYYLRLLGRKDSTLYDLPITNVLSGWLLIGALGHEAVVLEGESTRSDAIKVRPNWCCVDAKAKAFTVTANQDSFPEINRAIFDEYLEQIVRTTSDYFLSINHEVEHDIAGGMKHLNVSRLVSDRPQLTRIYRCPYWLRPGYVEELYRVASLPSARLRWWPH